MHAPTDYLSLIRHADELIKWGGYPVLMAIVFAETGLLIGFFLPGDSLLVTAGVLVSAGLVNPLELSPIVNLAMMNAVLMALAIAGDATGFAIGAKAGPALFNREQSTFFRKDHLVATHKFYEEHGGKTIVLARFMPFARTFAPVVAGAARMPYSRFLMFNVVGGVSWVASMTLLGFFLGQLLPAKKIEYIVYLIVVVSVLPPVVGWLKSRRAKPDTSVLI